LALAACGGADDPRPDVWLVTVDTLRADRPGFAGGSAETPHLDALAGEGAVFANALTPIPRTTQAMASIFTGVHPAGHGAIRLGDRLPAAAHTLAERLSEAGWWTAGVSANAVAGPAQGLDQGFGVFSKSETLTERYGLKRRGFHDDVPQVGKAEATTREALRLLDESPRGTPRLLWVHYMDPHFMYDPPAPFNRGVEDRPRFHRERARHRPVQAATFFDHHGLSSKFLPQQSALYDAEVAYVDRWIGALLENIDRDTLVVFTSDHGESLGEHGYYYEHGDFVYEASMAIPLVFWWPGRVPPGLRLDEPVSSLDILPTVLSLVGVEPGAEDAFAGIDLSAALKEGQGLAADRVHFGESGDALLDGNPRRAKGSERWSMLRQGRWKLIRIPGAESTHFELYDLATDPTESNDRAGAEPERVRAMAAALEAWNVDSQAATSPLPAEVEAELRALGYLE
jgi:arylsulfatase A-like enzyme